MHTGVSGDGGSSDLDNCLADCGAFSEVMASSRANGLDFVSLSEHVNGAEVAATAAGFAMSLQAQLEADDPEGGFVTLPGAEVWFSGEGAFYGHRNLYFAGSNTTLAGLTIDDARPDGESTDTTGCDGIWSFVEQVEARWGEVLFLPHHTAMVAPMGVDWACRQDSRAAHYGPSVEVYSRHGDSSSCATEFDPVWQPCVDDKTVHELLDIEPHGRNISFVGGTDGHDTQPGATCRRETQMQPHPYGGGLTAAVLDEGERFDREALYRAIVEGRTYASSGPMLPVTAVYRAGGHRIGELGEALVIPQGEALEVELGLPRERAPAITRIAFVDSVRELDLSPLGEGRWAIVLDAGDIPAWFYLRVEVDGELWYGGGDCDDGGEDSIERVWLSPSMVSTAPADSAEPGDSGSEHCAGGCAAASDSACAKSGTGCGLLGLTRLTLVTLLGLPLTLLRRRGGSRRTGRRPR